MVGVAVGVAVMVRVVVGVAVMVGVMVGVGVSRQQTGYRAVLVGAVLVALRRAPAATILRPPPAATLVSSRHPYLVRGVVRGVARVARKPRPRHTARARPCR